jgi:uncharacterized protein YcnI
MILRALVLSLVLLALLAPGAAAHVTLNPDAAPAGSFARLDVRVPTEREDASTTRVTVRLPEEILSVSFQPAPGWRRSVQMEELDEPVELFGEPVAERIASVTWSGGRIRPGEFAEFGMVARMPETEGRELVFPALQRYSSGEEVRWIGPAEADEPAPRVRVLAAEPEEGAEPPAGAGTEEQPAPQDDGADDGGRDGLTLGLAAGGLVAGVAGLGVALANRRRPAG